MNQNIFELSDQAKNRMTASEVIKAQEYLKEAEQQIWESKEGQAILDYMMLTGAELFIKPSGWSKLPPHLRKETPPTSDGVV
jgi:hypothetical protein